MTPHTLRPWIRRCFWGGAVTLFALIVATLLWGALASLGDRTGALVARSVALGALVAWAADLGALVALLSLAELAEDRAPTRPAGD